MQAAPNASFISLISSSAPSLINRFCKYHGCWRWICLWLQMGASWLLKVDFRMVVNWVHHQLLKMDLIMVANGCITAAEDWSAYGTCWALVTRRMCSCNSAAVTVILKWCRRSPWYKPDRFSLIMKWRIPSDTITSSSSRCKLGQTKILCVLILSILWFSVSNFFGDKSHEAIANFIFLVVNFNCL